MNKLHCQNEQLEGITATLQHKSLNQIQGKNEHFHTDLDLFSQLGVQDYQNTSWGIAYSRAVKKARKALTILSLFETRVIVWLGMPLEKFCTSSGLCKCSTE